MWTIKVHPLVWQEDLKKIPREEQRRIVRALRKKLGQDPYAFGKALTGPLKGYWRLRVTDYRVIYSIVEQEVLVRVVKIGIRRDAEVYEEMLKRLKRLS